MVKITKNAKSLPKTEQASIKAGAATCADSCSDGCIGQCDEGGVSNWETAIQWGFYGIYNVDTSYAIP